MFTSTHRTLSISLSLLFLGSPVLADPPWGRDFTQRDPSHHFTGKTIPEPPQQHAKWTPPDSRVPQEFVEAATLLFEQGLADPRGCEYREITVRFGLEREGEESNPGIRQWHGWVIPFKETDKHRFAVCWNGLVYPVLSIGDKADLQKDVKKAIEESIAKSNKFSDVMPALLLRLGEGDLAHKSWEANAQPRDDPAPAREEQDSYLKLAKNWAMVQRDRALSAHMRGDDVIALHGLRFLLAFAQVEGEAKKRGVMLDEEKPHFLDFLDQLPELLADQERRAREGKHESLICIGPGRIADQKKRIAALIERLDEDHNSTDWNDLGGADLESYPVFRALIREGKPALEPLLECFEKDSRMTRSNHRVLELTDQIAPRLGSCVAVHEAAYAALRGILADSNLELKEMDDTLAIGGADKRRELAGLIRSRLKTTNLILPEERYFVALADDNASPKEWGEAARWLMSYEPVVASCWSDRYAHQKPEQDKYKLTGESLRVKKNPSVTELLLKRIKQCDYIDASASLVLMLARWEPSASLQHLTELTKQLLEKRKWFEYIGVVERRCELHNTEALDDYADFIGSATPDMWHLSVLFRPMMVHPEHPGMVKAAEKLFGNPNSPWLPIVQEVQPPQLLSNVTQLIPTGLLQYSPFRQAVIKELSNKRGKGTVHADKDGSLSMCLPGIEQGGGTYGGQSDPDIPEGGVDGKFRICDYVAWKIGKAYNAAPWCELHWSEARRDEAVAACVEFLERYGDHLFTRQEALVNGRPATQKDVDKGKAIFTLEKEGETRVVAGMKLPLVAHWMTHKNSPDKSDKKTPITEYPRTGRIVQAEEVRKDGKWQRYYGFVGSNLIARVPAEEIELSPGGRLYWQMPDNRAALGSGFHARLDVPTLTFEAFEEEPPQLPADANLTFTITLRNSKGIEQASLAPEKSIHIRLLYSSECISPQGMLIPKAHRESEWVELPVKPDALFKAEKGKVLAPTEEMKLATLDLRQWFDTSKPGFYRLQLLPVQDPKASSNTFAEVPFSLGR